MQKKLAVFGLGILLTIAYQPSGWAGKVLDRIKQTGVITAGARKDSIPFGYVNAQGKWVGYSLDMLELIRRQTEKQLGKPIKLKVVEVTPGNRFSKIKDGSIDIECGTTSITWKREKEVDFSVSYFANGTQLLVKAKSPLNSIDTLAGKRIGVLANTTNERVIKTQQPAAKIVVIKNRNQGLEKLMAGEIDGFAGDGITLEGMRKASKTPQEFKIIPEFPYAYEAYACSLAQDQSQWRDLVNYSLLQFMEGVVTDNQKSVDIYEKWFGENGVVPYSREAINDYFQGIVNSYEWIPLIGK